MAEMVQRMIDNVPSGEYVPEADERLVMHLDWDGFEQLLAARGDRAPPRVAYLDGALELMSPTRNHEHLSRRLLMLLTTYFEATGIAGEPYGAWLLRERKRKAGAEPDECFVFGPELPPKRDRPDLVVEIVWTSGGIDKLEIYRRLGVGEVWFWSRGVIHVHVLTSDRYEPRDKSACLPDLDLALIARLMEIPALADATRELRASLGVR